MQQKREIEYIGIFKISEERLVLRKLRIRNVDQGVQLFDTNERMLIRRIPVKELVLHQTREDIFPIDRPRASSAEYGRLVLCGIELPGTSRERRAHTGTYDLLIASGAGSVFEDPNLVPSHAAARTGRRALSETGLHERSPDSRDKSACRGCKIHRNAPS